MRAALVAAAAAAACVAGLAAPAAASPAAVTITIRASSALPKVTGRTLVAYGGAANTARISGTVGGAPKGARATLLAKPFHGTFSSVAHVILGGGASAKYQFKVRPSLVTHYAVRVSGTGVTTKTSAERIVFVEAHAAIGGGRKCSRPERPVCHITLHVSVSVPPSAYRTETAKHWYLYSRLRLAPRHKPAPPKFLDLNRSATASKPRRLRASQFRITIRYAFRIGRHDAFRWKINFCTRDSERKDGLGLPGRHGCGDRQISAKRAYLG